MSGTLFGRVSVAGLLAVLVVGCNSSAVPGGAGPGPEIGVTRPSDSGAPSSETPSSEEPPRSNPRPEAPGPQPEAPSSQPEVPTPSTGDTIVAWVPPGPGGSFPHYSPDEPNNSEPAAAARWREAFGKRDCDAIATLGPERNQRQLYAGLGDACRAVLKGNDRLWTSAETALQHVDNPHECFDQLALRLLRDLVMAHRHAPHAQIHIVDSPPGTACQSNSPSPPASPSPTPTMPTARLRLPADRR